MRICTYNYSEAKDETSIKMSDAFWELHYITQLDALQDIVHDANKVYEDHLARWNTDLEKKKYQPDVNIRDATKHKQVVLCKHRK